MAVTPRTTASYLSVTVDRYVRNSVAQRRAKLFGEASDGSTLSRAALDGAERDDRRPESEVACPTWCPILVPRLHVRADVVADRVRADLENYHLRQGNAITS